MMIKNAHLFVVQSQRQEGSFLSERIKLLRNETGLDRKIGDPCESGLRAIRRSSKKKKTRMMDPLILQHRKKEKFVAKTISRLTSELRRADEKCARFRKESDQHATTVPNELRNFLHYGNGKAFLRSGNDL